MSAATSPTGAVVKAAVLQWCKDSAKRRPGLPATRLPGVQNFFSRGWANGSSLATVLHSIDPALVDLSAADKLAQKPRVQLCFDAARRAWGIEPPCTAQEWASSKRMKTDRLVGYLESIMHATSAPPSASGSVGTAGSASAAEEIVAAAAAEVSAAATAEATAAAAAAAKPGSASPRGSSTGPAREAATPTAPEAKTSGTVEAGSTSGVLAQEPAASAASGEGEGERDGSPSTSSPLDAEDRGQHSASGRGGASLPQQHQGAVSEAATEAEAQASPPEQPVVAAECGVESEALRSAQTKIQQLEQQLAEASGAKLHMVRSVEVLMQNLEQFRRACLVPDGRGGDVRDGFYHHPPHHPNRRRHHVLHQGRTPLTNRPHVDDLPSPVSRIESPYSHRPGGSALATREAPQQPGPQQQHQHHNNAHAPASPPPRGGSSSSSSQQHPSYRPYFRTPNAFGGSSRGSGDGGGGGGGGSGAFSYGSSRHSGFASGPPQRGQGLPFSAQRGSGPFFRPPPRAAQAAFARDNFPAWEDAFRDPVAQRTPATGTPPPFDLTLELQAELNAAGRRNGWTEDYSALERRPELSWSARKRAAFASEGGGGSGGGGGGSGGGARPTPFFRDTAHLRTPQSAMASASSVAPPSAAVAGVGPDGMLDSADNILAHSATGMLSPAAKVGPPPAPAGQGATFMERVEGGMAAQRRVLDEQMERLSQQQQRQRHNMLHLQHRQNHYAHLVQQQEQMLQRTSTSRSRSRLWDASDSVVVEETTDAHDYSDHAGGGSGGSLARSDLFDDMGDAHGLGSDDDDDDDGSGGGGSNGGGGGTHGGDGAAAANGPGAAATSPHGSGDGLEQMSTLSDDTVGISPIKGGSDDGGDSSGRVPSQTLRATTTTTTASASASAADSADASSSLLQTMALLSPGGIEPSPQQHGRARTASPPGTDEGGGGRPVAGTPPWGTPIPRDAERSGPGGGSRGGGGHGGGSRGSGGGAGAPPPPPPRSSSLRSSPPLSTGDLAGPSPPPAARRGGAVGPPPRSPVTADPLRRRRDERRSAAGAADSTAKRMAENMRRQGEDATNAALAAAEASRAAFEASTAYHAQFSRRHRQQRSQTHRHVQQSWNASHDSSASASSGLSASPTSFLAAGSGSSGGGGVVGGRSRSGSPPPVGAVHGSYYLKQLRSAQLRHHQLQLHGMPVRHHPSSAPGLMRAQARLHVSTMGTERSVATRASAYHSLTVRAAALGGPGALSPSSSMSGGGGGGGGADIGWSPIHGNRSPPLAAATAAAAGAQLFSRRKNALLNNYAYHRSF